MIMTMTIGVEEGIEIAQEGVEGEVVGVIPGGEGLRVVRDQAAKDRGRSGNVEFAVRKDTREKLVRINEMKSSRIILRLKFGDIFLKFSIMNFI